jgi:hypothetical protein
MGDLHNKVILIACDKFLKLLQFQVFEKGLKETFSVQDPLILKIIPKPRHFLAFLWTGKISKKL